MKMNSQLIFNKYSNRVKSSDCFRVLCHDKDTGIAHDVGWIQ